ncbi:MAG: hypothetical protein KGJ60_11540 [Verrucomicrobiota bacterium]|nr:hypothetical protein [Verrucomicrobiota bacterium]
MKTRQWKIECGGWMARSVLECGSPLSLFFRQAAGPRHCQSASGLAQSKPWRSFVAALALLGLAVCARAQQYSIDWYKISGGGGTSTNGQSSISGTIGQPDASGAMTGGTYSLTGGFWSLVSVVQTPGAPTLTVAHSGNSVVVSWALTAGFVLQQNSDLTTTNWTTSSYAVATNGSLESVTVAPPAGNLFFRLAHP